MDRILSRKVYMVDDDDAVRDSMRALLESSGLAVQDYPSARDFLTDMCKSHAGCLLLDLHMPGMSGVELLELLQHQGSKLPAVAVTGRSDPALKERVLRAGAIALLEKPVDETKLLQALDQAFAKTKN